MEIRTSTRAIWYYFANLFILYSCSKVGGALASILSAMELPVAVTVSVIVLHEPLTSLQIAGIILVILGMMLPTILSQRRQKENL